MTALEHGYVPEEHAPDPVISHGDPTMPGKVGIWLFLASEIMFFIGILGTYIIFRSGAPELFSKHAHTLSKSLAAFNTVVLIFSSLTMALAVDAAQKGNRGKLVRFLLMTLLCAATFMAVKVIEYADKAHHHTIVAVGDAPVAVKAPIEPNQTIYATVTNSSKQAFNPETGKFEGLSKANWSKYALPFQPAPEAGTYLATIPAGAAGPNRVNVYVQGTPTPNPKDKPIKLKPDAIDYGGGVYVFDGHVRDEGDTYAFTGWRAPYPKGGNGVNVNLLSESDVRAMPGARKFEQEMPIAKAVINSDVNYGPWKNNFFASYFTLTGVHGLHVLGGMIPLTILLLQGLRGRLFPNHTEYVGLYWHFVDLVWIFLFPLLYLI